MRSFDAALRTALDFISNPHKLWSSGRLCDRHAVLKLAFPGDFNIIGIRDLEPLKRRYLSRYYGGLQKAISSGGERGFEPSVRFEPYARFPGVYLKPLGRLSHMGGFPAITGSAKNKVFPRAREGVSAISQTRLIIALAEGSTLATISNRPPRS